MRSMKLYLDLPVGSSYFTTSAFSWPESASTLRISPASTGFENSTTSSVPPRKSTPQFSMCPRLLKTKALSGSITIVSTTRTIDRPIQYFCLPMNSKVEPGLMISKNFCC